MCGCGPLAELRASLSVFSGHDVIAPKYAVHSTPDGVSASASRKKPQRSNPCARSGSEIENSSKARTTWPELSR